MKYELGTDKLRKMGDLFVPKSDSFSMNTEKKTHIPYIYNAFNNKNSM